MRTPLKARFGAVAVAAVLALSVSACGAGGGDSSSESFDVLAVIGTTGRTADNTKLVLTGLKASMKELNSNGGIGGKTVKLKVLNDQGDPTQAVTALQNYLSGGKTPDLVLAGGTSPETLALLPALSRKKILSIAATSNLQINDPKKYPYHFGAAHGSDDELRTIKAELEGVGAKKVSMLVSNDAFGTGEADSVSAALKGTGMTLTTVEYDVNGVDNTVAYQRALKTNPDAVFMDGTGEAAGRLLTARQKLASTIPTFGGPGMTLVPPTSFVPESALTNFKAVTPTVTVYKAAADRTAVMKTFLADVGDLKGQPIFLSEMAYDGLRAVAFAAEKADGTSADAIKKQLESGPSDGTFVGDGYVYSSSDHFPSGDGNTFSWITPLSVEDGMWKS